MTAERMLGEMLKVTPRNTGAKGIGKSAVPNRNSTPPTLGDLGVSRKEAMQAQALVDMPDELFEKVKTGELTVPKAIQQDKMGVHYSSDTDEWNSPEKVLSLV